MRWPCGATVSVHGITCSTATASATQGLPLVHFSAQLEDLWDTSLTFELNLSTFGPHPRVNLGCVGDRVS